MDYEEKIENITDEFENEYSMKLQMELKDLEIKFSIERVFIY